MDGRHVLASHRIWDPKSHRPLKGGPSIRPSAQERPWTERRGTRDRTRPQACTIRRSQASRRHRRRRGNRLRNSFPRYNNHSTYIRREGERARRRSPLKSFYCPHIYRQKYTKKQKPPPPLPQPSTTKPSETTAGNSSRPRTRQNECPARTHCPVPRAAEAI